MEGGGSRRSQRFSYLVACENARRILADPAVLVAARAHLDRFSKDDPHQRDAYALWSGLLAQGPEAVAAALLDTSQRGDYTREAAPSFGGLPPAVRTRLLREARAGAGSGGNGAAWRPGRHS